MGPQNPWFWVLLVLFWYHGFRHWKMITRKKCKPAVWLMGTLAGLLLLGGAEKVHPVVITIGLVVLAVIDRTLPSLCWHPIRIAWVPPNQRRALCDHGADGDNCSGSRLSSGYGQLLVSGLVLFANRTRTLDGKALYRFPFPYQCPRCSAKLTAPDIVIRTIDVSEVHQVLNGPFNVAVSLPYCGACQTSGFDVESYLTLDIPDTGLGVMVSAGNREFFESTVECAKAAVASVSDSGVASFLQERVRPKFLSRFGLDGLVQHTKNELEQSQVEEHW